MKELQKILYIEDEEDIAAIAKIALEDLGGFELLYCPSGKQALRKISEFNPDLIIIDVMMPEMDGPTTLKEIRKIPDFSKTPVIFMTAKTQATEIKEYLAIGAVSVITKPFDPVTLADTIRKIWKRGYEPNSTR